MGFPRRKWILDLMAGRGVFLVAAVLAGVVLVAAPSAEASRIVRIEVQGPIFHPVLEYLKIGLEQAEAQEADALLLELDTPGGSLSATKDIVQQILAAPVPVIVYVSPSGAGAISAGTFITLAGHVAAMAPGTTIGAAHPVSVTGGGGDDRQSEIMGEKAENYAVSFIEAIAGQRGRNVEWAAEAVRKSSAITAEKALEKDVIDLVEPTAQKLLEVIHGRTVEVQGREVTLATAEPSFLEVEMTTQQAFYFLLARPTVIFLLLVVGLAGLYLEMQAPGMLVPGVVGAICLLLALIGFSVVPVNFTGVALFVFGMVLLVSELFVPSFGALGVGGLVCLVGGALLLFDTVEAPGLVVNRGMIAATAFGLGAFILTAGSLVVRSHRSRIRFGRESMIGKTAVVRSRLDPRGKVFVAGEIWNAVVEDGTPVDEGEEVEVVALEGLRLTVRVKQSVVEGTDG